MNQLIERARQDANAIKNRLYTSQLANGRANGLFVRLKEDLESPEILLLKKSGGVLIRKLTPKQKANALGHIANMERKVNTAVDFINSSENEGKIYAVLASLSKLAERSMNLEISSLTGKPDKSAVSYAIRNGFAQRQISQIEKFISDFLPFGAKLKMGKDAYMKPASEGNDGQAVFLTHPNMGGREKVGEISITRDPTLIEVLNYANMSKYSYMVISPDSNYVDIVDKSVYIRVNNQQIAKTGTLPKKHLDSALERCGVLFNKLVADLGKPMLENYILALVSPKAGDSQNLINITVASFILKPGDYRLAGDKGLQVFENMPVMIKFDQTAQSLKMDMTIADINGTRLIETMELGEYLEK